MQEIEEEIAKKLKDVPKVAVLVTFDMDDIPKVAFKGTPTSRHIRMATNKIYAAYNIWRKKAYVQDKKRIKQKEAINAERRSDT